MKTISKEEDRPLFREKSEKSRLTRAEYDRKFVRAGHKPGSKVCDHKHYSFEKHGRYCMCGTIMCDPGD